MNRKLKPVHLKFNAEAVSLIMTQPRLELLAAVKKKGEYVSLDDLASDLGRHKSPVSRTVALLEEHGLLNVESVGRVRHIRLRGWPLIIK